MQVGNVYYNVENIYLYQLIPYFNVSDQSDCSIRGGLFHLHVLHSTSSFTNRIALFEGINVDY